MFWKGNGYVLSASIFEVNLFLTIFVVPIFRTLFKTFQLMYENMFCNLFSRLTGVYAFILCFNMTLYGVFSQAPAGDVAREVEFCRDVWWKNLLYVGIYRFGLDNPAAFIGVSL